ncbi:hypothetical protein BH11PLA1_BH11PLA1_06620 [soil metagenome]
MPLPAAANQNDALSEVYAKSLHDLIESRSGLAGVSSAVAELQVIGEVAQRDRRFAAFLVSRIIGTEQKQASLRTMFAGQVSTEVLNFLFVLAQNERLDKLASITASLAQMVQRREGAVDVTVTTAAPLAPAALEELRGRIEGKLGGKKPVMKTAVNPAMIGGMRLQIGDKLYDASVETRLRQLREQLASVGLPAVRAAAERILAV